MTANPPDSAPQDAATWADPVEIANCYIKDPSYGDLYRLSKAFIEQDAQVTTLRTALKESHCPYSQITVASCINRKRCTCDSYAALSALQEKSNG